MRGKRAWTPWPDPALREPLPPGLRPHQHEPDHLYGWVFLQHEVWVDYWGNEHEIDLMARDYVANVIGFCERQSLGIALIVWAEIAYRLLLYRAGVGEPQPEVLNLAAGLREIGTTGNDSVQDFLHELPLLQALTVRLDSFPEEAL